MAAAAPFAMKALPYIIKGGSAIAGSLLGKKLSGPSKTQQAGLTGAQNSLQTLQGMVQPLMGSGMNMIGRGGQNLDQAANYYSGVMGSRSAALSHLTPELSAISDTYRGGTANINRNLRGGSRDYALGEMARQKTGQLASVLPNARREGAEALGNLGGLRLQAGTNLTAQGGNLASNASQAANSLYQLGTQQSQQEAQGGKTMGNFIYDILKNIPGGGGGGGGAAPVGTPSLPSSYMPALLGQNRP